MSTAIKKRVLLLLLMLFALWPPAHHLLVLRYQLNPWKFAGWSMYCTPPNQVTVLAVDVGGAVRRPLPLAMAPPAVRRQLSIYHGTREQFGVFARPHRLANAILRAEPRIRELVIVVDNLRLSPLDDRFRNSRDVYRYSRP